MGVAHPWACLLKVSIQQTNCVLDFNTRCPDCLTTYTRLGRDMAESIRIFKDMDLLGVRIVSMADGIDTSTSTSKLPYYFKSIMNEVYLDDPKDKVLRGMKGQVERGYFVGGRVYGYEREEVLDPSGAKDNH